MLALRAALKVDADLLDAAERGSIEGLATALDRAIEGSDRHAIAAAQETLDQASQDFAARRMDRGIRTALSGRALDDVERRIGGAAD